MAAPATASSTSGPLPGGALAEPKAPVSERPAKTLPGLIGILINLVMLAGGIVLVGLGATAGGPSTEFQPIDDPGWIDPGSSGPNVAMIVTGSVVLVIHLLVACTDLTIVHPGTTKVLTFFGNYSGTVTRPGLSMIMPLTSRNTVSIRVRNFETKELKVNDADGSPVIVAAIVVWQVTETALASFAVENYKKFVAVQAEAALRHVTMAYPYDGPDGATTLRGSTAEISAELAKEVATRVAIAGVSIIEARISKLSYAPEIAEAMLRRQQAGAIIAAREKIVEGAVSVVHEALAQLEAEGTVRLDDERRAAMVSNLLVVLTSDQQTSPVINTGTLYT